MTSNQSVNLIDKTIQTFTEDKVREHPLSPEELVDAVKLAWSMVKNFQLPDYGVTIEELGLSASSIGSIFHTCFALVMSNRYPGMWKQEEKKKDKDLVCLIDDRYSIEVKTSTSKKSVYGNRSYAQKSQQVKEKGGYLLTINYDKIEKGKDAQIRLIRFGYVEHEDWIPQKAPSGQQSRLSKEVYANKLVELYRA